MNHIYFSITLLLIWLSFQWHFFTNFIFSSIQIFLNLTLSIISLSHKSHHFFTFALISSPWPSLPPLPVLPVGLDCHLHYDIISIDTLSQRYHYYLYTSLLVLYELHRLSGCLMQLWHVWHDGSRGVRKAKSFSVRRRHRHVPTTLLASHCRSA